MVATTGASLLPQEAMTDFGKLARLAYVLTPNIPELKILLGCADQKIDTVKDLEDLAQQACRNLGSVWVLAKGGHVPFQEDHTAARKPEQRKVIVNVLAGPGGQLVNIQSDYQDSKNTHGTGCSLACKSWIILFSCGAAAVHDMVTIMIITIQGCMLTMP